jgi:hypothetical protein
MACYKELLGRTEEKHDTTGSFIKIQTRYLLPTWFHFVQELKKITE